MLGHPGGLARRRVHVPGRARGHGHGSSSRSAGGSTGRHSAVDPHDRLGHRPGRQAPDRAGTRDGRRRCVHAAHRHPRRRRRPLRARGDPRRCPQARGSHPGAPPGSRGFRRPQRRPRHRQVPPLPRLPPPRRLPLLRRRPPLRPIQPKAAGLPSHEADCAGAVPRRGAHPAVGPSRSHRSRSQSRDLGADPHPRHRSRPSRPSGSVWPSRPHACAPPPDAPTPGTSGRPGTRSRGSTPPGGPRHGARAAIPQSSGGGDPVGPHARPVRLRRRRTGKPVTCPRWAALARSSGR